MFISAVACSRTTLAVALDLPLALSFSRSTSRCISSDSVSIPQAGARVVCVCVWPVLCGSWFFGSWVMGRNVCDVCDVCDVL